MPSKPKVPPPVNHAPDPLADAIKEWNKLVDWLDEGERREKELRAYIVAQLFPTLKEGSNTAVVERLSLQVKVTHKLYRHVDEPTLQSMTPALLKAGVPVDALIARKPELLVKAYRALNDRQRNLFDRVLSIREGSPSVTIEPCHQPRK